MKGLKRKLAYLLVFAMVLGIMAPMTMTAKAANDPFSDCEFSVSDDAEYLHITDLKEGDTVRYLFSTNEKIAVGDKIGNGNAYAALTGSNTEGGKLKKDTLWDAMAPEAMIPTDVTIKSVKSASATTQSGIGTNNFMGDVVAGDDYVLIPFQAGTSTPASIAAILTVTLPAATATADLSITPTNSVDGISVTTNASIQSETDTLSFDVEVKDINEDAKATFQVTAGKYRFQIIVGANIGSMPTLKAPASGDDCEGWINIGWISKSKAGHLILEMTRGTETVYKDIEIKKQETANNLKAFYAGSIEQTAADKEAGKGSMTYKKNKTVPLDNNFVGDPETGYIAFYKNDGTTVVDPSSVLWSERVKAPSKEVDEGLLSEAMPRFKAKGMKLYFSTKATLVSGEAGALTLTWPSKVASLSFPKQANAPSVTLDVNKLTVSLKNTQEYRIKDEDGVLHNWVKVAETKKISLTDLVVDKAASAGQDTLLSTEALYSGKIELQVRTAAANGKSASKTNIVSLIPVTTEGAIAVKYAQNDSVVSPKIELSLKNNDVNKGIVVENKDGNNAYQVVYLKDGEPEATTRLSTLKKSRSITISANSYSKSLNNGGYIYIRQAGAKPNFAGQWTKVPLNGLTPAAVVAPEVATMTAVVAGATTGAITTVTVDGANGVLNNAVANVSMSAVSGSGATTGSAVLSITVNPGAAGDATVTVTGGQGFTVPGKITFANGKADLLVEFAVPDVAGDKDGTITIKVGNVTIGTINVTATTTVAAP